MANVKTLSIGLNYTPGEANLRWAEADALALHRFFRSGVGPNVPDTDAGLLIGPHATRRNIERAIIQAHWERPEYFALTFSGHSGPDGIVVRDGELSHEDLSRMLRLLGSRSTLLIADTCFAASMARHLREGRGLAGLSASWVDALANSTPGLRAMFASSSNSVSHESDEVRHGYFTGSFLDAVKTMDGDMGTRDGNFFISDRALFNEAARVTRARSPGQRPESWRLTGDLPLAVSQWLPIGAVEFVGCYEHPAALEIRMRVVDRRFMATTLHFDVTNMMGSTIFSGTRDVVPETNDSLIATPVLVPEQAIAQDGLSRASFVRTGSAGLIWHLSLRDSRNRVLAREIVTASVRRLRAAV